MSSYQSWPSSLRLAVVPKGFQPGAGANFFNALFVASFNAVCAKPSFFLSSLWDSCVLRLIALILSSASSPGLHQGTSPTVSENGNSVANSSEDFSAVLLTDERDFFFLGVLGNKRFPFDLILKENLGIFLLSGVLGDCLMAGVMGVCRLTETAFLLIPF